MRRAMSWFVLLTVSVLLSGCDSGGIEPGVPSGVTGGMDFSKTPDPMLHPNRNDPISQKAAKQAAKKAAH